VLSMDFWKETTAGLRSFVERRPLGRMEAALIEGAKAELLYREQLSTTALARYVARAAMRCMEAADDYERSEDSRKVHLRWGVALDAEAAQLCDKYTGYPTKKGGPNDSDL